MDQTNKSKCPGEMELLTFYENRLSFLRRSQVGKHLAGCDSCRESFALLVRMGADAGEPELAQDDLVSAQVARVLALIERDEANQPALTGSIERPLVAGKPGWLGAVWPGMRFTTPALAAIAALLMLAVGAPVVYIVSTRQSAADQAYRALAKAVGKQRRVEAAVSGELPYSPYSSLRGAGETDDLDFDRAEGKLKSVGGLSGPVETRQLMARVYIERNEGDDPNSALAILLDLAQAGVKSAQVLNDTGVALFELRKYAEALEYFEKALAADPTMNRALFNKALAERQIGRIPEARQDLEEFMRSSASPQWKREAREASERLK